MTRIRTIACLLAAGSLLATTTVASAQTTGLPPEIMDLELRLQRVVFNEVNPLAFAAQYSCQSPDPDAVAQASADLSQLEADADDVAASESNGFLRSMALRVAQSAHTQNLGLVSGVTTQLPTRCG